MKHVLRARVRSFVTWVAFALTIMLVFEANRAAADSPSNANAQTQPPKKKKKKPKEPPPPPAPSASAAPLPEVRSENGKTYDPLFDDPPPAPSASASSETTTEPPEKKSKLDKIEHEESSNISARVSLETAGYDDTERVSVFTQSLAAQVYNPTAGWSVSGNYLIDVVSAASADIVSTASPPFHEVRNAGGLTGTYDFGNLTATIAGSVSREPDYLSLGGGGSVTYDLFEKNASILLGYNYGHDTQGKNSTPFSVFSRDLDKNALKGGLTLIVNRRALMTFILDAIYETGDQSKVYRFIPLFAPTAVVTPGLSVDEVNAMRLPERAAESLPLTRQRYAFSVLFAHRFDTATIRVEERGYLDSWGLKASTTDFRFLLDVGNRVTLGPHLRLHSQTPVVFWQRAYTATSLNDLPVYRTGDRELGPLTSVSGGTFLRVYLGSAGDPRSWAVGLDTFVTYTSYPDDLYLQSRIAALGALSLEANF